ncbi:branched-chain amino acid ABC transporter permease [Bosea sp. (in: a-proteobacteria)]|uniref:branched-chain amino acid ABC transporter permease n=1 Tax=Bosea sp. (in: a-proteobacteria) TaxID=1871050 RepID=UPI00260B0E5F|nr:branched-chain amino acid ABC transporter permease [Bosea sp. (in: a-proteobacteria)]MCO5089563.1 branched-chain amino acid ABC transporter permease [Bosea sp. (in: a-proteobacteria)]
MNIVQQLVNGVIIGHGYALVAIGWTVLLGTARLVNFGHGQMYMFGAFLTWWFMRAFGLPYLLSIPLAVVAGAVLGALMQRALIRLTIEQNLVSLMIATLGFGQILEGTAGTLFGAQSQFIDSPFDKINISFGTVIFTAQDVLVVLVTIILFLALRFIMVRTKLGAWIRMVAEDPKLTQLAGISTSWVYFVVFAFEGAAVVFAAAVVAPRMPIDPSMGFDQVIMTFVVVVLGGMGSITGSYVAGLVLGIFTAVVGAFVAPAYTSAAAFLVLIFIMVARPGGLAAGKRA